MFSFLCNRLNRFTYIIIITMLYLGASGVLAQQVSFSDQIAIANTTNNPSSVCNADLDGDGDQDLISASVRDNKIAWYENLDGMNCFGLQKIICTNAMGALSVFCADLDGDGDQDILSASSGDDKIVWYENMDSSGIFGEQHIISGNLTSASAVFSIDIDSDGDHDVIAGSSWANIVVWYENLDGLGNFGFQNIISDNVAGLTSIYCTDINGDNFIDLLSSSWWDNKIAWYENLNGTGFGTEQIITTDLQFATSVFCSDLDGDDDMDVLFSSYNDGKIAWHENLNGLGNFGEQQIISNTSYGAGSVQCADIDNDGDMDVLATSGNDDPIKWYENLDGNGSFADPHVIFTPSYEVIFAYSFDYDADGDQDVFYISKYYDIIAYFDNLNGLGDFGEEVIISMNARSANSVLSADLDGDGDNDVISGSGGPIPVAWYENLDGFGTFSIQKTISSEIDYASCIDCSDLNGDGYLDVVYASDNDDIIAWVENTDGNGNFASQQIVTIEADWPVSIMCNDIDGDNDYDILSASYQDNKIAWYENMDGLGNFGDQQIITTETDGAYFVFSSDIDSDGDFDVLSASIFDDKVAWYENLDGLGDFGDQQIITTDADGARCVISTDIDGDGDEDLVVAAFWGNMIIWFENLDGSGNFGTQNIITEDAIEVNHIWFADLDNDGDQDVLSASNEDDDIAWYENLDGMGNFGLKQIIWSYAWGARAVFAEDLNNDGFVDVLSASSLDNTIAWYRNVTGTSVYPWEDPQSIPDSKTLLINFPNPFNPTTTISFSIPNESKIELSIYNIKGQKVKQLISNQFSTGEHTVVWDGRDDNGKSVSSGIYFYKLTVGKFEETRKMILLK